MKRIVAKEFLLFVACFVTVLFVALFGWLRNEWVELGAASKGREHDEQVKALDSLRQHTVPRHLDFLDLFEPEFVRENCEVFLVSPFWTMDPFLTGGPSGPIFSKLQDDPFSEFGGQQILPPWQKINRRYLMCFVKALDRQDYLTSNQLSRLAEKCGRSADKVDELKGQLKSDMERHTGTWRPPANADEVYNPHAPEYEMTTWKEALEQKGIPSEEMSKHLLDSDSDTLRLFPLLLATRGMLCDTTPYAELRKGFDYLKQRRVLRCGVDDLLYTLQNKAAPPSQEALDAFAKQRALVNELRQEQNNARANLWSEAKQWEVVKWAAIVLLVLVYPLRLLVLGTRWALRTLQA